MSQQNIQEMSEPEVFGQVFRNALSNAFWFGIGAVVIALIGNLFWKIAVGLFVIYVIITAVDALWVLITVLLPGAITIPLAIRAGRKAMGKEAWMLLSAAVRIIDVGVGLALTWYLYRRLF